MSIQSHSVTKTADESANDTDNNVAKHIYWEDCPEIISF